MVMQVPARAGDAGLHVVPLAGSVMLPACFSAQYFQTSEPEPRMLPPKWPRIIGPAGMKIERQVHARCAPMSSAGRGLVAAAHQHRAVDRVLAQQLLGLHGQEVAVEHGGGLDEGLASDIAGSSTGKPPACQTPRLTSSARCRKCVWQGLMSLQVLMMPITGLPMKSSRS